MIEDKDYRALYVEKIKGMTADELFDGFDNFCNLNQDATLLRRQKKILTTPLDLNIDLLDIFNILACDETARLPKIKTTKATTRNATARTAITRESPTCFSISYKGKNTDKMSFTDFLDKSDIDSLKHIKYVHDSVLDKSGAKRRRMRPTSALSIFDLEKPVLSTENDSMSFREDLDNNVQINTIKDVCRRK